jgi:hypothetical protein
MLLRILLFSFSIMPVSAFAAAPSIAMMLQCEQDSDCHVYQNVCGTEGWKPVNSTFRQWVEDQMEAGCSGSTQELKPEVGCVQQQCTLTK